MHGVVTPVVRKHVELDPKHDTDIVTILMPRMVEMNALQILGQKPELVTLEPVLVCILH